MRQSLLINADGSIKIDSRELSPEFSRTIRMVRYRPGINLYPTSEKSIDSLPNIETADFQLVWKTRHYDIFEEVQP